MLPQSVFSQKFLVLRFKQAVACFEKMIPKYATIRPSCFGRPGLLLWVPCLLLAIEIQAKAQSVVPPSLTAVTKGSTLEISGSEGFDWVDVFFNRNTNGSEFVHIRVNGGKVNGKAADQLPLTGINLIRVNLRGQNDNISFSLGNPKLITNWKGDVTIDYGARSSTSKSHENLNFGPNLKFRNVRVSVSDPNKLNVSRHPSTKIDLFVINNRTQ